MTRRSFLALTAAAALLASPAAAITRCVRPTPYPGCFPSIQAAVDESIPGDVINLAPGVYFENVNIQAGKDGLSIVGAGKLRTIIDPDDPLTGNAFTVASNAVKIKNLGIRNGQAHGIEIGGVADVVIQGVRIVGLRSTLSAGIFGPGDDLQLVNNEIRAAGRVGIDVWGLNLIITGNTVAQAPRGIVFEGAGARVTSNKVTGVGDGGIQGESDGGVVSGNTVELVGTDGLGVSGQNPTVQANKLINAAEVQIGCTPACSGGLASANTSLGSNDFGFSIFANGPGFVARGNKVSWSNGPGFHINAIEAIANVATDIGVFGNHDGPDCFQLDGVVAQTTLTSNTATRCAGSGFSVIAINATLRGNTATQVGLNGFIVSDPFSTGNALTGNKALSSNAAGFAVIDAVGTTLSGNTGSKNRYGFCDDGTSTTLGQNSFGIPPVSNVCDVVQ